MRRTLAVIVAVAVPFLARAEPGSGMPQCNLSLDGKLYLVVKGAVLLPEHVDIETFDNGYELEAGAGFRPTESFALELAIGRSSLGGSVPSYSGGVEVGRAELDVVRYPVSLAAKFITSAGPVSFHSMFGIAVSYMTIDGRFEVSGVTVSRDSASGMATSFFFGGGASVPVAPRVAVGAEFKYVIGDTKEVSREMGFNIDHLALGGAVFVTL